MSTYEDHSNKRIVFERSVSIEDNGGYRIRVSFTPKSRLTSILEKFKMIKPDEPVVEIQEVGGTQHEYVSVPEERSYTGTFFARRGRYETRMSFDKSTAKYWKVDVQIERVFS